MVQAQPTWDNGLLKGIGQYTWPGIELGHPPLPNNTFFEYVDALRSGDIDLFKEIERHSGQWWHAALDRGGGACLHFAAENGQLAAVRFLVEHRQADVNQQDVTRGQTPLHRCTRMAHYTMQPYLEVAPVSTVLSIESCSLPSGFHFPIIEVFEYLLSKGADPWLMAQSSDGMESRSVLDMAAKKGRGWHTGELRTKLRELIDKYQHVPKAPIIKYDGPMVGPEAQKVLQTWRSLEVQVPPYNWRAPPTAGFQGCSGLRLSAPDPWRPAGENDGSCFLRPMTDAELESQSQEVRRKGHTRL